MANRIRIVGVDPGLVRTGYGVIEVSGNRLGLVEGGVVQGGDTLLPLEERLSSLYKGMSEVLIEYNPDAMALEDLYSHYGHPITAVLMGHARGVICLAAAQRGVPVFSYVSTQVKSSLVGSGRATKAQIQKAMQARLGLAQIPEPHDVADALAIAVCHHHISKVSDMHSRALTSTYKRSRGMDL